MNPSQDATPLSKRYQEMVDAGVIELGAKPPARFTYPSMFVPVPSVTTYGTNDYRGLGEEVRAQLERHINRDRI